MASALALLSADDWLDGFSVETVMSLFDFFPVVFGALFLLVLLAVPFGTTPGPFVEAVEPAGCWLPPYLQILSC